MVLLYLITIVCSCFTLIHVIALLTTSRVAISTAAFIRTGIIRTVGVLVARVCAVTFVYVRTTRTVTFKPHVTAAVEPTHEVCAGSVCVTTTVALRAFVDI